MIIKLLKENPIFVEMFLYGIIGSISAGLDSLTYYLLTRELMLSEFVANFFGINLGITLSFILNTFINFKKTDKLIKRAASFYFVGYIGLLLSMIILCIGIKIININDMVVKIVSVFIVALFQFILNKLVTFGPVIESIEKNIERRFANNG
ncbi:GtrA family protein [Pelotomaculum isophthalicicum JI]|uniref:GtrA family protein n=1 Tax=Pelotomaculum isophthalicicum JI TaxID=947010 RepID=A0A9X4GYK9_9FIRM|nr:GtrA family protein [Pelotomaculum isophthalicicum]MDF9407897.1 GtrA family protein [Pelotomaculum isophthalicicum JI]